MKKIVYVILVLSTISVAAYSAELWNGINIGMSIEEAENILYERLGARDVTSDYLMSGDWSNSHIIFHGHSPTSMKSYYRGLLFYTKDHSFRQDRGFSNITVYIDQNNIVVGVSLEWASTNLPNMLENARIAYGGNENLVEVDTMFGINKYYIWELDYKIASLTNFAIMTTTILDKKWYYENTFDEEEIQSGIIY